MPPALWLIALPVGAVPLVYLLRRVSVGAIVAASIAFLSAWLAMHLPIGLILNVLGRPIELDQLSRIILVLLFGTTAVLFLVTFPSVPLAGKQRVPEAGAGTGRTFYPIGLAILGSIVAASLSRHLGIAAIFIEVAAIFVVFVIQGQRLESTRAALRFLVLMSLATPFFLLAAWRIDIYQLSGGLQPASYLSQTALLAGIGFAFWLAVVPFHGWLTATAAESAPAPAAFVLITFPVVAFSTLIHLLIDAPWLINSSQLAGAIIVAGGLTAFVGGALAGVQRSFSTLMGWAALYDLGCTLVILGIGGETAVITIVVGLTIRALALILIAAGTSAIRLHLAGDSFAQLTGFARRMPVATAGLIVGGLTLAGAPLTAGFPLRWQLLQSAATVDPRWPLLLALAGLGVAVGYLRGGRVLLSLSSAQNKKGRPQAEVAFSLQEPILLVIVIGLLGITSIVLGLLPALLVEPLQTLLMGISVPIR